MAAAEARNAAQGDVLRREVEADRQRRVSADMARLDELRSSNRTLLLHHAYKRLAGLFEEAAPQCRSDEGRLACEVHAERYAKLAWLKAYIIAQVAREPMRWGWGLRGSMVDVLGADEKGVRIPTGRVPWSQVSTAQFARWGEYYVKQAGLTAQTVGNLQLAMAVFYDEHGATAKAEDSRRRAVMDWERLREEADRLLPE
jgi:hypothetical protein